MPRKVYNVKVIEQGTEGDGLYDQDADVIVAAEHQVLALTPQDAVKAWADEIELEESS
jgi:hypothetical protein